MITTIKTVARLLTAGRLCVAGFLQGADGVVLKPVLGPSKGLREVHFYEKLFSDECQDDVLLDLRQFVAKFLGVWTTPEHPGSESWTSSHFWATVCKTVRHMLSDIDNVNATLHSGCSVCLSVCPV